jgi:RsiW-degrading membrane proteinase PrsW (M82 family)
MVPLIEEALKPLGLWLLARRSLSPAEGFAIGLLSGAGFALTESLGYASAGLQAESQGWAIIVLARAGTAMMHITTAGMVGWGMASAWSKKGIYRLVIGYLGAVLIHSLWNMITVGVGIVAVQSLPSPALLGSVQLVCAGGLGLLLLALFIWVNRALRHAIIPQLGATPPQPIIKLEDLTNGKPD